MSCPPPKERPRRRHSCRSFESPFECNGNRLDVWDIGRAPKDANPGRARPRRPHRSNFFVPQRLLQELKKQLDFKNRQSLVVTKMESKLSHRLWLAKKGTQVESPTLTWDYGNSVTRLGSNANFAILKINKVFLYLRDFPVVNKMESKLSHRLWVEKTGTKKESPPTLTWEEGDSSRVTDFDLRLWKLSDSTWVQRKFCDFENRRSFFVP